MACEQEERTVKKLGAEYEKLFDKRMEIDRKIREVKSGRWDAALEILEGFPLNPAKSSRGVKKLVDSHDQLTKLEKVRQDAFDAETKSVDKLWKAMQARDDCRKKKKPQPPVAVGAYKLFVALKYNQRPIDSGPDDYMTTQGELTFGPVSLPGGIDRAPTGSGFLLELMVGSGSGTATRVLPPGVHPPGCTESWHGSVGTKWTATMKNAEQKLLMLMFGLDPSGGVHAAENIHYDKDCINQPGAYPPGRMRPDLIDALFKAQREQLLQINLPEPPTKKNVQLVQLEGAEWTLTVERTD